VRTRNLFGVIILFGIYSFLMASVLMVLDAVDVAMTEAAVGAGVSTVVLLATLHLTNTMEYPKKRSTILPLFVAIGTGLALLAGTLDLPPFGTSNAPIHQHVAPYYLDNIYKDTGVPNLVTAILGDYRGYDTFGEVVVIFTAGIAILLLLKGRRRQYDKDGRDQGAA
jgi:multicomponent Na+:H+ antiporter subunit B